MIASRASRAGGNAVAPEPGCGGAALLILDGARVGADEAGDGRGLQWSMSTMGIAMVVRLRIR